MHHCTPVTAVPQLHISLGFFEKPYIPEMGQKPKNACMFRKAGCKEQGHCKTIPVYHNSTVLMCLCCPALTLLCFPRAPVAVAAAAMSTAEMLAAGMKGKGFAVLHTYMDHLW